MPPGKTDVLPKNEFAIIINVTPRRQRRCGLAPKIWAFACREAKIPRLIGAETQAGTESRIIEPVLCDGPRFRTRREGRILHFNSVIKLTKLAGDRNATRVTGSPDYRIKRVLSVVVRPVDKIQW